MSENIPTNIADAFTKAANAALQKFPYTKFQCASISAWIAEYINGQGISCKVALGTLRCNGSYAFKYSGPIPRQAKNSIHWDGHAWVEFEQRIIGDASLFRTARSLTDESNLKKHLENLGLLHRGAIMFSYADAKQHNGLRYVRKSYLHGEIVPTLISGLEELNRPR